MAQDNTMNDQITIALITAVPPLLAVIFAWWSNKRAIQEVHLSLNSRLDALLKAEKLVSKQEGRDEIK